jgi:hypothetical protein
MARAAAGMGLAAGFLLVAGASGVQFAFALEAAEFGAIGSVRGEFLVCEAVRVAAIRVLGSAAAAAGVWSGEGHGRE